MYSNKDYESTADKNTSYNKLNKYVTYNSTKCRKRNSVWSLFDKRFIIYIIIMYYNYIVVRYL